MRYALVVLSCLACCARPTWAHDSCCAKAAAAVAGQAPVEWIPDPKARQPESWDEEEDGPWEPPLIQKPPPGPLEVFRSEVVNSVSDAMPWLLLGLLSTGMLQGFSPSQETLQRHLASQGPSAVAKGAALGLLTPLCSCGALPFALGLAGAGATAKTVVAFLVAAQSAGIDSLFFTVGVLGPGPAALRMLSAATLAVFCGLVVADSPASSHSQLPRKTAGMLTNMLEGLHEALTETLREVAPSVAFGIIVNAALSAFLPKGGLAVAATLGGIPGRVVVLLLALPLNFCEHAAVPLAVALQKAGASGGLAFAVLATLPGINLATLGVIGSVAGAAGAGRVAFASCLTGLVGSLVADWAKLEVVQIGHGQGMLPEWYVYSSKRILSAAVALMVLREVRQRTVGKTAATCCKDASCKSD